MSEIKREDEGSVNSNKKNLINTIVTVTIALMAIIVIGLIISGAWNGSLTTLSSNYLTYENYTKIYNGMTYSQVVEIFDGHQGVLDSTASSNDPTFHYTLSYYSWKNSSGTKCVVVGFENGKVCAKSQYGLG